MSFFNVLISWVMLVVVWVVEMEMCSWVVLGGIVGGWMVGIYRFFFYRVLVRLIVVLLA